MPELVDQFIVTTQGDGYLVKLKNQRKPEFLVSPAGVCSCKKKDCLHIKAARKYIKNGGQRVVESRQSPIKPDLEPAKPVIPAPNVCPICGEKTAVDWRFSSPRHGVGWRCPEPVGLAHMIETRYLAVLKGFYAPDFEVLPGITRSQLSTGPIGYWPDSNRYR